MAKLLEEYASGGSIGFAFVAWVLGAFGKTDFATVLTLLSISLAITGKKIK